MFTKVFQAFIRHKIAIAAILLINVFILAFGYSLRDPITQQSLTERLEELEYYFQIFGVSRVCLEIYIYFKWRAFVAWCRRFFNLGYRKAWFLLQCKSIFKLLLIFDAATLVMLSFF